MDLQYLLPLIGRFFNRQFPFGTWDQVVEIDELEKIRERAIKSDSLVATVACCLDDANSSKNLEMCATHIPALCVLHVFSNLFSRL